MNFRLSLVAVVWMAGMSVRADSFPPAPIQLDLPELGGGRVSLASYRGKVVLLNLWSTTCPPCRVEIPWLIELHQRLGPKGFAVVSVSVDDTPDRLRPYVRKIGITYPVLIGVNEEDRVDKAVPGLWALPTTYILGRDGRVMKKHVGLASKAQLTQWIDEALKKPPTAQP